MHEVVANVASACGTKAHLEITPLTPAVINDPQVTQVALAVAQALVGTENIMTNEKTMGSEDAAFFQREIPGCYFFLGSSNPEQGLEASHHNPYFDFDERVLSTGASVMTGIIAHYLLETGQSK
jgi:amidohydrolase